MSLAIFNGSPRGPKSNSNVISTWFLNGYQKDHQIFYLNKAKQYENYIQEATRFDEYLFVMPLYVDGMPGQVKHFFEIMYNYKDQFEGKKATCIIHSGFGEGIHNRSLQAYLSRFFKLMNMNLHGVIILPGSEGFRLMPPNITKKKSTIVMVLGRNFMNNETYDVKLLDRLIGKEKMSIVGKILFSIFSKLGVTNLYWNNVLKSNNAYKKRFDAPYSKSPFTN